MIIHALKIQDFPVGDNIFTVFCIFLTLTCIKILRQFQTFLLIKEILMTQRVLVKKRNRYLVPSIGD